MAQNSSAYALILLAAFFFYGHASHAAEADVKSLIESFVIKHTDHNNDEIVTVSINQFELTKLAQCSSPIDVSFSKEGGSSQANVVALKCNGAENWSVYVPIQIQIMTNVLSANRLLSVGDLVSENDLTYSQYDRNRLYDGYFKDKKEVIGLAAAKTIIAGTALSKKNLKQIPLVRKNQTVTLAINRGALEIKMIGIAKADGYLNSSVPILNPTSKKIVDAVVTGKDKAEINY